MDNAHINRTRKFPGHTLVELKAVLAADPTKAAVRAEIEARESGRSIHFKVPQV